MTPDAESGKGSGEQAPSPAPKKKAVKKPKAEPKVEAKVEPKIAAPKAVTPSAPKVRRKAGEARDIGIDVTPPTNTCTDVNCPFHGVLAVRGMIIDGIVVTDKMDKSAVVSRTRLRFVPKFERYEKMTSNYTVHNPPCIAAKKGDAVTIMECRPISKTKAFVIIENRGGAVNEGGSR